MAVMRSGRFNCRNQDKTSCMEMHETGDAICKDVILSIASYSAATFTALTLVSVLRLIPNSSTLSPLVQQARLDQWRFSVDKFTADFPRFKRTSDSHTPS